MRLLMSTELYLTLIDLERKIHIVLPSQVPFILFYIDLIVCHFKLYEFSVLCSHSHALNLFKIIIVHKIQSQTHC